MGTWALDITSNSFLISLEISRFISQTHRKKTRVLNPDDHIMEDFFLLILDAKNVLSLIESSGSHDMHFMYKLTPGSIIFINLYFSLCLGTFSLSLVRK